ncbi:PREDICTED: 39S ribosomal protein L36, mitochondrial [Gavialis gangeticus]|uniref:39S ribosomal protein L36, mitochondrial n=1 Tax=Gavialis gangeticus TaxID=94835 RepID=UPI00092EEBEA|nr:PREDICTED: 39S ribosomal protein L36, mitochondrial [Gavialis gangeticus]XP_019364745.1 PREDICTED: 39S ribosomal protein L36, mitochondrial [Gavialis gangeticus]XP_019364746.1 PREDICTED: 39S ribosomal protein L36, mitochondrial [Gavialis gangeticus]
MAALLVRRLSVAALALSRSGLPMWAPVAVGAAPRPLLAAAPLPPLPAPSAGMKAKVVLRRRCKDCFIVRRNGRLFVYCKTTPRHKQRQL